MELNKNSNFEIAQEMTNLVYQVIIKVYFLLLIEKEVRFILIDADLILVQLQVKFATVVQVCGKCTTVKV